MTGTRPVGVVVTVLVVLALAVGGVAAGVSAGGHSTQDGVESEGSAPGGSVSGPTFDGPGIAQGSSEVGLELRPTNQTVAPGGNATYDIVITDPENGTSGYSFNVSVGNLGVAEINGFTLDRNPLADNSFITDDNRTLALDVALGGNNYAPAPEVTVATVNVTAVGSPDDSTDIGFEYDPDQSVLDNDNILYTVTSDQSASLRVDAPPEFLVSNLTPADATVVEDETLNISADVTNVGRSGTQTVSLDVDGLTRDETVTLGNGQNQTVTFEAVDTGVLGAGGYQHTVSSANESVSGNLTVLSAANFAVSLVGTTTPVAGERLNVTAEVTNTGDVEDTQTIALAVGALGGDSTNVTLAGGVSTNVTLSVGTSEGDAGEYTATASSADDSASTNVTVLEPANVVVSIAETNTPVTEGESLSVTATVTNTGGAEDTQTVELTAGTLGSSSTSVTLGGGVSTNVTLSASTGTGDAGAYTATVSSADDAASANVTVLEPANFAVTVTETTTPVAGERLNVTAEITNTGDVADTQTIELAVGALGSSSTSVSLGGGASTSVTLSVGTSDGDAGAYTTTVSSADDSETANVTVLAPANFAVSLGGTTTPVEGERVNVTTEIQNTGDIEDSQTIELAVGALGSDSTSVTLGGGASTNLTLSVGTNSGDAGEYTATVSSADDSETANVTVLAPANFAVSLGGTTTPVEGEQLNVTAEVSNTGDVEATQTVTLDVGALGTDSTSVTLGGGASTNLTLSVATSSGDAGEYTATVSSSDDSASVNVTVLEPANFAVSITETTTPVEGEQLNVTTEIQNTGDIEDSQTIALDVGALGTDSTTVTLGGDVSTNLTLSVGTGSGDAGAYTATVSSADDAASANVTVLEPAEFAVSIAETSTPVEGEQLNVTAEIQNTGDFEDSQTISLSAGTLGSDSTSVTLPGGASTNVTLSVGTGAGDAGAYTATVSSGDDAASANVTVLAPAELVVSITETTTPVAGENLSVTATVENTGDVEDTQTIDLDAGALGTDSTTVTLGGGASTNVTLSVSTGAGDAGTYTAAVSGADDSETASVTVLEPATFAVSIPETSTPVEGEQLTVTAEIQNTGDVEDTQTIGLDAGALGTDSASVTLAGDASTNLTLSVGTGSGDAGEYTATVSSADDAASANVTVLAPANFAVSITETSTPVEGEQLTVTAEIQNTGDIEDTQTIGLDAGALGTDSTSVTLAGGASTSLTLSVGTGSGDAGAYTATVSSADEMATANVTVLAPGSLSVTITETSTPVEGEQLNVSAEIANTGEEANTQTVALDVGSLGSASTSVTLAGGASTNVTLSVSTGAGDAGAYTATVSSADDADTASVTVLAPAAFAVDLVETSAPVEGERLVVTTAVENTGGVEGTQTLTLDVGALGSNSTSVTLGGGESTNLTLSVGTGSGDAGEYTATVSGADDVDSATVTVLEPAAFAVTLADAGGPVTGGETLTVEYAVENTGDVTATQTVAFAVDGTTEATESNLTLAGGETFAGEFSYETDEGDAPGVTVSVASADDTATANVTVLAPAAFAVELTGTGGSVVAGESLTVSYEVTNTGDVGATQTVEFAVEGTVEATESVTLGGGETFAGGFSYETTGGDVPKLNVSVASADDTVTETVTVLSPGAFVVELTSLDDSVVAGENLTVAYEVTNSGDTEATQTVEIAVAGTVEDTQSVTLGGGETFAGEFSYETGEGDVPGLNVLVSSVDDTVTATVPVLEPAAFAVTLTDVAGPVVAGESLTVGYEVTNTGGVEATQTVEFAVDGVTEDTEANVTLGGGETFAGQFAYETIEEDVPGVTVSVSSADDTVTETVAVLAPVDPTPALSNLTIAGDGNETLVLDGAGENVTVDVTNLGTTSTAFNVTLTLEGPETVELTETVAVGGGETTALTFENATDAVDAGAYNVTLSATDTELTGALTVSVTVDDGQPATDTTGDARLNDIDGDRAFSIFDVQEFFVNFQTPTLQNNPAAFNFDGSGDGEVNIFDVQALFVELVLQDT